MTQVLVFRKKEMDKKEYRVQMKHNFLWKQNLLTPRNYFMRIMRDLMKFIKRADILQEIQRTV